MRFSPLGMTPFPICQHKLPSLLVEEGILLWNSPFFEGGRRVFFFFFFFFRVGSFPRFYDFLIDLLQDGEEFLISLFMVSDLPFFPLEILLVWTAF